ncbi:unnamed protein product [Symbiodinium sp. CCMP2456]|nr:unnamed protein product [Symbiodinium sp. CCMP2456]
MEVFLLYLGGIALGLLTIELLGTSCSACKQLICHKWQINQNPTPVVPDWIYTAATIGIAIGVVTLVVVFISHRRRVTRSKTYRTMVQAAEEHHMQCHAAIPNDSGVMHFTDSWKARPFRLRDIVRVSRLRVYDLNIVGVGFPLYNNAMISFLQRGHCCKSGDMTASQQTVVLKLRPADWGVLQHVQGPLKVLQALIGQHDSDLILDCTDIRSVVLGAADIVQGESVQMAELFCGGFNGFAQAAFVLNRGSVPLHACWSLDIDEDCDRMIKCREPATQFLRSPQELEEAVSLHSDLVHVSADIKWNWWMRCFLHMPVQLVAASPPCQPWSSAGSESGLDSSEGQLMLRLIDVVSAVGVPVIVLEQVAGFVQHPHYPIVMQAWALAGYEVKWQDTLNLLDVLPCQRVRHICVLARTGPLPDVSISPVSWALGRRQTLGHAHAVFDLPGPLLRAAIPDDAALAKYLDPWYVPAPVRVGARQQTPAQYRVRTVDGHASTFLAMYQSQHTLPESMLSRKGILGCLLQHQGCLRFFAGAEVASLHGAVQPILLDAQAAVQMRMLGNAIAVPQAVVGLVYGCLVLGLEGVPDPASAVHLACRLRLHNQNTVLIPVDSDWILCSREQTEAVIKSGGGLPKTAWATPPSQVLTEVTLQAGDVQQQLCVPVGMRPVDLLAHIGCVAAPGLPHLSQQPLLSCATIQVLAPMSLPAEPSVGEKDGCLHWSVVLTPGRVYVVSTASPSTWSQLLCVAEDVHVEDCRLSLFSVYGTRLEHLQDFQHCMVAVPEDPDLPVFPLLHLAHAGEQLRVFRLRGGLAAVSPADGAMNLWLGTPFHVLSALGWQAAVHGYPVEPGATMTISMVPLPVSVRVSEDQLQGLWRIWLLVAFLQQCRATQNTGATIAVEVQIVAKTVWTGHLPADLETQMLEQWWAKASNMCELPPRSRIFSGPFPLPPSLLLQDVRSQERRHVVRKSGLLLLSLQPECVGGGVKSENASWTQTRAASLCLSNGLDLARTTQFVDQLTTAAGVPKLAAVLQGPTSERWSNVLDLAKQVNVATPVVTGHQAKADVRMKKAAQRRRAQERYSIQASDVSLTPDFFFNADGSPANILPGLQPGASGVFLVDEGEAPELLSALSGVQPDELCLVVLGHHCPDPSRCDGKLSFPACACSDAAPLLLAGCLHNLGGRKVVTKHQSDVAVDLPEVFCCSFEAYGDEFDGESWQALTASPVKTVQDIFRKAGIDKAFANPWGRQFFAGDKPTVPANAEKAVFQAKVDAKVVQQMLEVSGHNRVYMVPRNPDRTLQHEYSIVWLGNSKAEVLKLSLQVKGQLGIVRSRARFGIRVAATKFEQTFGQLRPGQVAPAKVEVKHLFRVGPLPAGAGADEIREWAMKAAWQVRVIKALGASHWLLGAAGEPPSVFPAFNGQTVLITKLPQRAPQRSELQSGSFNSRQSFPSGQRAEEDPWNLSDPWSSYTAKQKLQATSAPLQPANTAPAPRHLGGPTEQRFKEQEGRLQALETGLQNLRLHHDKQHEEILHQQKADRAAAQSSTEQLQDRIALIGADFSKQLQQSVASLQGAQAQQQQQMQSSLDEIKQLMMSCREGRDVSKKAKMAAEKDDL